MKKTLDVVEHHECEILEKFNARLGKTQYGIQRLSDNHWYWTRWNVDSILKLGNAEMNL